jgi:hypothetical protein
MRKGGFIICFDACFSLMVKRSLPATSISVKDCVTEKGHINKDDRM